ncbi:hypothetical protein EJ08DRAFT_698779 [Tothia fuscella]|uniref:Uncharacterized protein n=1 Tax=Tothia fuscella TaxID=1048955 RepID=A0A9P4TW86_9PEZI|nr:hypothetical protein EJ08DRAFT_698779 [Tothia fuscella]
MKSLEVADIRAVSKKARFTAPNGLKPKALAGADYKHYNKTHNNNQLNKAVIMLKSLFMTSILLCINTIYALPTVKPEDHIHVELWGGVGRKGDSHSLWDLTPDVRKELPYNINPTFGKPHFYAYSGSIAIEDNMHQLVFLWH